MFRIQTIMIWLLVASAFFGCYSDNINVDISNVHVFTVINNK